MSLDAKQRKMCEARRRSPHELRVLTKRTLTGGGSEPGACLTPKTPTGPVFWARGLWLLALLAGTLSSVASAPLHDPLRPQFAASVEIVTVHAATGDVIPARVYLFKGGKPFRLSPVESLLPLRPDLFYRERLWRREDQPKTLEVTASELSHLILLSGRVRFDLPRSRTDIGETYRLEAYRGMFFGPAISEFTLEAGEEKQVKLELEPIAPGHQEEWLSGDDHIHLMRAREDNDIFLGWLAAEDLSVANFLELQRQQHAAVQYAFGRDGEARSAGYSIRSGHESRSFFYGHTLFLGPDRMVGPLSVGEVYGNSPEAYPFPTPLFNQARKLNATVGFAHFYGSQPHSTLILNLVRNTIDFVELFQFGKLHPQDWYQLLNAGFRVVGNAGSDFPANLGEYESWPRIFPLLGPERALVRGKAGESAYDAWAEGVRRGTAVVSNGPLLEFSANHETSGAIVPWAGSSPRIEGVARAFFHRPIEKIEIIANGKTVAVRAGDLRSTDLTLHFNFPIHESTWVAARTKARNLEGESEIWAHANPLYFLKDGNPVHFKDAREAVRARWAEEARYYQNPSLIFANPEQHRELLSLIEETDRILAAPPAPWPLDLLSQGQ